MIDDTHLMSPFADSVKSSKPKSEMALTFKLEPRREEASSPSPAHTQPPMGIEQPNELATSPSVPKYIISPVRKGILARSVELLSSPQLLDAFPGPTCMDMDILF